MLSYRHAFHAGNFADVLKHVVLIGILDHLVRKAAPLRYVDTHAGGGLYRLDSPEALKTGEFRGGIGRLWHRGDLPAALARYVELVRRCNGGSHLAVYPGSPWLALQLLRGQDRLDLCELHPRDFETLQGTLRGSAGRVPRNVRCHHADGFAISIGLVPPIERRGLVLIDPSYEIKSDYDRVVSHVQALHRRFATGVYAVWYPIVDAARAGRMEEAWRKSGIRRIDVYEVARSGKAAATGLVGTGMFVVNPPWRLADEVEAALRYFTPLLPDEDVEWQFRVEELVGE